MKTVENRYSKTDTIVSDNTGQRYCATIYTYESTKSLYDVYVINKSYKNQEKLYKVNMRLSDKTPYHEAIEKFFCIWETGK